MAKINIITPVKKRPIWLLTLLSLFPFDTRQEYPDDKIGDILSSVVEYLRTFTYTRRNATQRLEATHFIERCEDRITVKTVNYTPYLIIQIVK